MDRVTDAGDIWTLTPTLEDRYLGARYAGISLPWTWDRMEQENDRRHATRNRAFNVVKGQVAQRALRRALADRGADVRVQEKSHRETDAYDLRFDSHPAVTDLDLKTFNHFADYGVDEKPPLDAGLIADNATYEGPEWGRFFPQLVPADQFSQDKDAYCFAVSDSIDYRTTVEGRPGYELYAFPTPDAAVGDYLVSDIAERDAAEEHFSLALRVDAPERIGDLSVKVVGERNGDLEEEWVDVGADPAVVGPLAGVDSFKVREDAYRTLDRTDAEIVVSIEAADRPAPAGSMRLGAADFHNLLLPTEFTVYVVGWLPKSAFRERAIRRPGWVGPAADSFPENRPWDFVTDEDRREFRQQGLEWVLADDGGVRGALRRNAGCYYYPKINPDDLRYGGLRKTNLYVLPGDLRPMDALVR